MNDDDDEQPAGDDFDDTPLPHEQPTVDAGSLKTYRKRRSKARLDQRDAKAFWQAVFASEVGRREMWRLLQECHPFDTRFACGPNGFPNSEATWFDAGQQQFGLRLYQSWLRLDRAGVLAMHDECDPRFSTADPPPRKRAD